MTSMLYNQGEISMVESLVKSTVDKMDGALDTVDNACKPLMSGDAFKGDAQGAYTDSMNVAREAALEIAQTMNRLAQAVKDAGISMAEADAMAAKWFQT